MFNAHEQTLMIPETLTDLFARIRTYPEALLTAGNTWIASSPLGQVRARHSDLISLHRVEELQRIFRNDRALELGAMVNLQKLLSLDKALIPPSLRKALVQTIPYPARSLATMGGNLCIAEPILNLLPFMAAWDARLELRRQGATRTIPALEFTTQSQELSLEQGEILTKVRLPLGRWTHQFFERIDADPPLPSMAIIGLARISGNSVDDLRVFIALSNFRHLHFPQLDIQVIGQRVPLSRREVENYLQTQRSLLVQEDDEALMSLETRVQGLSQLFLERLETWRDSDRLASLGSIL